MKTSFHRAAGWMLVALAWPVLTACAGGINLGFSLPIGRNAGVGVSVGSDGRIGTSVGVGVGGGAVSVGTSGNLPVRQAGSEEPEASD